MTFPNENLKKLDASRAGTVTLGDITISRMAFGTMQLPGPGVWGGPRDPQEARRVLRRAVELGINYLDTASFYGPLVSDQLIVEALYPYPAGLTIGTKVGAWRGSDKRLQVCHATVEHANQIWRTGRYTTEDPEIVTCQAVQFGFKRLISLLLAAMVGGWQELLAYIEHPERFPWYRPDTDWSRVPPLKEVRPEEDEVEDEDVDHEGGARTECMRAIPSPANLSS